MLMSARFRRTGVDNSTQVKRTRQELTVSEDEELCRLGDERRVKPTTGQMAVVRS